MIIIVIDIVIDRKLIFVSEFFTNKRELMPVEWGDKSLELPVSNNNNNDNGISFWRHFRVLFYVISLYKI